MTVQTMQFHYDPEEHSRASERRRRTFKHERVVHRAVLLSTIDIPELSKMLKFVGNNWRGTNRYRSTTM